MQSRIRRLEVLFVLSILLNVSFLIFGFTEKKPNKFEEIDVERINIVEADGTLKLALFNSARLKRGLDGDKRSGTGRISGMLFYNEEGYETGGLVFDGKKIDSGQDSGIGLMFDGYRQDQTIALQHNERVDSTSSFYEDGLKIISRPDRSNVREEYDFYALLNPKKFGDSDTPKLSKSEIDSLEFVLSAQNKVAQKRLFVGSRRGNAGNGWYDESGLFIKNKYGKDMIKIYVDANNIPKIEILDTLGQTIKHDLIPKNK